jgi:hypothetical protein
LTEELAGDAETHLDEPGGRKDHGALHSMVGEIGDQDGIQLALKDRGEGFDTLP